MKLSKRSALRALAVLAVTVPLGACTMVGGVGSPPAPVAGAGAPRTPAPADRPGSMLDAPPGRDAEHVTERVVEIALESIGTPYRWGGTGANGFDCSGLIQFAYGELGIPLPRVSSDQIRSGAPVRPDPRQLRPGDVLGFSADGSGKTSHVGLYIGEDDFIHSGSSGVRVSTLRNPYWQRTLVAARRIVD